MPVYILVLFRNLWKKKTILLGAIPYVLLSAISNLWALPFAVAPYLDPPGYQNLPVHRG